MRFNSSIVILLFSTLLPLGAAGAFAQKVKEKGAVHSEGGARGEGKAQTSEETIPATDTVNVTLVTGDGKVVVRGWDRREVRARATGAMPPKIVFRVAGKMEPAARLEILLFKKFKEGEEEQIESDEVNSDITLDVPRGATLYLKTQDGDLEVEDVAEARVGSTGGRVDLRHISKATDASSVGGDVTLEDSSGRARLHSFGSVIEVREFRQTDASDFLEVKTASGDILLDRVSAARVKASTISGVLKLMGPLARGGNYEFTTTTGDVTLVLPPDSSFNLNAKVSESGEIITEFPLKYKGAASPLSHLQAGRLHGTHGSGDANITLVSFSGTLRLRKK